MRARRTRDKAAEDRSALDLLLGDVSGEVIGPGRAELAAAMGPSSVVVGLVVRQDRPQMSFAEDRIRSVTSVRAVSTNRSAKAFASRLRGRIFAAWMPMLARTTSKDPENCPAREPEAGGAVAEVHQEMPDLLRGPRAVRVRGDAEDVHVAGADFDDEETAGRGHNDLPRVKIPEAHRNAPQGSAQDDQHRSTTRRAVRQYPRIPAVHPRRLLTARRAARPAGPARRRDHHRVPDVFHAVHASPARCGNNAVSRLSPCSETSQARRGALAAPAGGMTD